MSSYRELETIGATAIDGDKIEFLAAKGFVTAQFVDKSPRGIANLIGLDANKPRVVPLSHATWIGVEGREQVLIAAARAALANRETSPPQKQLHSELTAGEDPPEDWNKVGRSLFNRRRTQTIRTR